MESARSEYYTGREQFGRPNDYEVRFVCTIGGILYDPGQHPDEPEYEWNAYDIKDGAAHFRMAVPECVQDFNKLQKSFTVYSKHTLWHQM